jgi:very-short-patch-repair endonuclease
MRTAYGQYASPHIDAARLAGCRLAGTVSHTSAAIHWGWAVKTVPAAPHVTVSRHRKITRERREGTVLHWRNLTADDVSDGWVTSPVRTVIDCCVDMPFDEAVAVFDSSWRAGLKPREVQVAARKLPLKQRNRVWAVARAADPRAANPFESVLRAIALDVRGLKLEPQHVIKDRGFYARVDLADEKLRIVVEADSIEFHMSRKAFDSDCRRYNGLLLRDWMVLRFTWEQVMFEPEFVAATLRAAVDLKRRRQRRRLSGADRSTGSNAQIGA